MLAHCSNGSVFWLVAGLPVLQGFGSAIAECSGALLVPAYLIAYQVDRI